MKTYVGEHWGDAVYIVEGRSRKKLDPRLDVMCKSTGFCWGMPHADGSAQLAFAILVDHTKDVGTAIRYYQRLKYRTVATYLKDAPFELRSEEVEKHLVDMRRIEDETRQDRAAVLRDRPVPMIDVGPDVKWTKFDEPKQNRPREE